MMKKFVVFFCLLLSVSAMAQIKTPQPSSAGSVSSVIGLTDVKIDYSRPKSKGRKIFGDGDAFLVPFGKIWRTGANSGTKISFSDDVKVEGVSVAKGEYLIFSWPGATEWTISLYKDLAIGGNTAAYKAENEVAKFKVKSEKLTERVETFTMAISDISDDNTTGKVQIAWENTSVKFTVNSEYDSKVMKSIADNTKVNPSNLMAAARYYFDTKKDLNQALAWTNEYFKDGKNGEQFWNINFKAKLLAAMGKKAEAIEAAKQSIEAAKKAPDDFGFIKQNEDLIKSLK